jgi:tRNA(fMet)-specific endonuclease VapC
MEIAWQYGEIYRQLSGQGKLIGANDLWIAATAIAHGFGLVTSNQSELSRVPGLQVETY